MQNVKPQQASTPARRALGQAIESACIQWGMFAGIILAWKLVETQEVPTMATDGPTLFYNPEFTLGNTCAENAWLVLHEAGHVWLGHHIRLATYERKQANIAADLALNSIIREQAPPGFMAKWLLPGKGQYAKLPMGKDAEFYYAKLGSQKPQPQPQQQQQPGQEQETGDSQGQPQPDTRDTTPEQDSQADQESSQGQDSQQPAQDSPQQAQSTPGQGKDSPQGQKPAQGQPSAQGKANNGQPGQSNTQDSQGDSQSCETEQADTGTPSASQQGTKAKATPSLADSTGHTLGDVLPAPMGDSPEEQAKAEGQWQTVLAQSLALSEMCGTCPGWFKSHTEKMLGSSHTDWRTLLRRFLTRTVPQGQTYTRPSRRHCHRRDVIMPARRSRGASDGLILADTSGSCFAEIQASVLPEIEKIMTTMRASSVVLMQCDTQITAERKFSAFDFPLRMASAPDWQGGGGTDLNPALRKIAQERAKYRWLVIVTDFYWGYQSAVNPGIPTLWVSVARPGWQPSKQDQPRFGDFVATKAQQQ